LATGLLLTNVVNRGFLVEEHMSIVALSSARGVAVTSELEDLFQEHHQLIYRTAYSGSSPSATTRARF
jgi:hypothetical protein